MNMHDNTYYAGASADGELPVYALQSKSQTPNVPHVVYHPLGSSRNSVVASSCLGSCCGDGAGRKGDLAALVVTHA